MNLYARYVGWLYFKYFVIIFVALTLFYVGIDILTNLKDMPASANVVSTYPAEAKSLFVFIGS